MKKRPLIILLLAVAHLCAPFFNFVIQAYWAQTELFHYVQLYFRPENFQRHWFNFLAPMMAGVLILIFRRWSYYLYMMVMLALAFVSYARFLEKPSTFGIAPILIAYVTNLAIVIFLLRPRVRNIYFDPRMRWWESAPRYAIDVICEYGKDKISGSGVVRNISKTGLYLSTESQPEDNAIINVKFQYEDNPIELLGQVIHHGYGDQKGVGLKFLLNPKSRRVVRDLLSKLQDRDRQSGAQPLRA